MDGGHGLQQAMSNSDLVGELSKKDEDKRSKIY